MPDGQSDLLTVTEVAKREHLNKSSVSRYCAQHPEIKVGKKVSWSKWCNHRANNLDLDDTSQAQPPAGGQHGNAVAPSAGTGGTVIHEDTLRQSRAKAEREETRLLKEQLDLQERLGTVVPVDEVIEAMTDAARDLNDAMMRAEKELAPSLCEIITPHEMRLALSELRRRAMTEFAAALELRTSEFATQPEMNQESDLDAAE